MPDVKKGSFNDGEFEDFLAEIAPTLEQRDRKSVV